MNKTLIFGHRNPDTDSICSALAYANLKTALGEQVEAVRLGHYGAETQYVLDYFQAEAPRLVEAAAGESHTVILVDHNERQQSISDIDEVTVLEVIDHHRIANFETSNPLYYRAEPVGCTATIVNKLYKEHGVEVSRQMAGLMLSAIVSDTLLLKSPTCTEQDAAAARELAAVAEVELAKYGLDMLKAGANLADLAIPQLVSMDSKEFLMNGRKVEIAQVNTVDLNDVLSRQELVEGTLNGIITAKNLDLFLFVVTDILNNDSIGIALGNAAEAVEEAYDTKLVANKAYLKGVVSRKSQIVPVLTDVFNKH